MRMRPARGIGGELAESLRRGCGRSRGLAVTGERAATVRSTLIGGDGRGGTATHAVAGRVASDGGFGTGSGVVTDVCTGDKSHRTVAGGRAMRMVVALAVLAMPAGAPAAAQASRIVFVSAASADAARAGHSHLYAVTPSGAGRHAITGGAGADFEPAVSPNGRRVAYSHYGSLSSTTRSLWLTGINGGRAHRVLTAPDMGTPAWTPDGKWIAFSTRRGLDLVRPDGSGRHALFHPTGAAEPYMTSDPSFSADGSLLAFDDSNAIWTMPTDAGAAPTRLATGMWPAFAPTGKTIAYTGKGVCLATVGVAGHRCYGAGGMRQGGSGIHPSWSRDGKRIAINRGYLPHPYQELAIFTVSTHTQTRITNDFVDEWQASWGR